MTVRAVMGSLGMVLLFNCAPLRTAQAPTGPHFKIMTWNVNWGGPGADLVSEAILEEDPDILCLQETTPKWERFLVPRLKHRLPHVAFHHSRGAGGLAFFSKLPFEEKSLDESPAGWFPAWTGIAETPLGKVQVQNLHLQPAVNERGSVTPYAYLSGAPRARLAEVRGFEPRFDPAMPAIIAGDLNEGSSRAVGHLTSKGFVDALPEFDRSTRSWQWTTSAGITVSGRLDHLLYRRDLLCIEARVLKAGASDHYPVVAVFERAP